MNGVDVAAATAGVTVAPEPVVIIRGDCDIAIVVMGCCREVMYDVAAVGCGGLSKHASFGATTSPFLALSTCQVDLDTNLQVTT